MKTVSKVLILFNLISCSRFYAPVHSIERPIDAIKNYSAANRIILLHDSSFTYLMANLSVENDSMHALLLRKESNIAFNWRISHNNSLYRVPLSDTSIANAVHVFTSHTLTHGDNVQFSICACDIADVQSLKYDKKETSRRRFIAALAGVVTVGTAALFLSLKSLMTL